MKKLRIVLPLFLAAAALLWVFNPISNVNASGQKSSLREDGGLGPFHPIVFQGHAMVNIVTEDEPPEDCATSGGDYCGCLVTHNGTTTFEDPTGITEYGCTVVPIGYTMVSYFEKKKEGGSGTPIPTGIGNP